MVSNARLDLPEPDSPVKTIMASLGRSSETSFRLCSRAPRTTRRSATVRSVSPGLGRWLGVGLGLGEAQPIVSGGSDILLRLRPESQTACSFRVPGPPGALVARVPRGLGDGRPSSTTIAWVIRFPPGGFLAGFPSAGPGLAA